MARGKFITLEGIDGAGKSSQHAFIVGHLRSRGKTVVSTREPGGTTLGEKLRGLLLADPMHVETETLLMFAARREHIERLIRPALERGDWVVSDRFTDASYAYQGGGRGLAAARLEVLEAWVHEDLQPDCTFLFDLPVAVAQQRLARMQNLPDRFEQEKADFYERVRNAYLERARKHAARFRIIDADRTLVEINALLEKSLQGFCE